MCQIMNRRLQFIFSIAYFLLAVAESQSLSNTLNLQPNNPEKDATLMRFNYFDLELLKEFSETQGNVFISPASIKLTLALILEGAKGNSAKEIENALRIHNIDSQEIREILRDILYNLNERSQNTLLEIANSVFVSNKFQVLPNYRHKLFEYYKASVNDLDFSNQQQASKIINSWARNATHGFINEIISPGNLAAQTTIILANAVFFKSKWKIEFDKNNTKIKCFISPTRNCVQVPFMQVGDIFNYSLVTDLKAHAIELPYHDDKYSMLILVPTNDNNIGVLTRDIQHAKFNSIIDQLRPNDLTIELPKFEIDYTVDLVEYLRPLKIHEIFGPNANLTGIIPNENIKVSNIIHKAKVEVNEEGTVASAITTAVVIPLMGSTTQRIIINQPFIFFIYHKESKHIIFEGILSEPKQSNIPYYQSQVRSSIIKEPLYLSQQYQYIPQTHQQQQPTNQYRFN